MRAFPHLILPFPLPHCSFYVYRFSYSQGRNLLTRTFLRTDWKIFLIWYIHRHHTWVWSQKSKQQEVQENIQLIFGRVFVPSTQIEVDEGKWENNKGSCWFDLQEWKVLVVYFFQNKLWSRVDCPVSYFLLMLRSGSYPCWVFKVSLLNRGYTGLTHPQKKWKILVTCQSWSQGKNNTRVWGGYLVEMKKRWKRW